MITFIRTAGGIGDTVEPILRKKQSAHFTHKVGFFHT